MRKEANRINEAITKMESSKLKSDEPAFSKQSGVTNGGLYGMSERDNWLLASSPRDQ